MSKVESKSLAELEADLFLAERAFKRVPSDENKEALAKVKKALEAVQGIKKLPVVATQPVKKTPAAPKATTPKASTAKPAVKPATPPTETDESKKK